MSSEVPPVSEGQRRKASAFRALHADGIFVMPCAWDAMSALLFQAAGFEGLGTTSGGVNWSRGRRDYIYAVPRSTMLDEYAAIASATALPVSGDLENGYGATAADVADTIRVAIGQGLVGGSIEDQSSTPEPGLLPAAQVAERIAAARAAADSVLGDFVITARPESFYGGVDNPLADAIERANLYAEAGADCVFVPGASTPEAIRELVTSINVPISLGMGTGGAELGLDAMAELGVRRVSTGGAIPRALYTHLTEISREILDQRAFTFVADAMSDSDVEQMMP